MRKTICIFVLFLVCWCLTAGEETFNASSFSNRVDKLFEKWDTKTSPGAAVLVQLHGRDIYKKCFGLANIEHGIPITAETQFDLASVSKHLTALGILVLEKRGQLNLDDNIRHYLPELPEFGQKITIKNLLNQSSGLWEFWTILNRYSGFKNRDYIIMNDVLKLIKHQPKLNFEPGTKFEYTNTNYSLLSEIIKRMTGESFGDWTKKHLFEPLGMEHTHFQEDCTKLILKKASAYQRRNNELILARPSNVEVPGSAHAFTSLNDMAKWIDNFRTKKLGGKAVFQKLLTRGKLENGTGISYAAGLIVRSYKGVPIVEHSGQTGGYKTMLVYCPSIELGVVVLANERSIDAYGLSHNILDLYLDKKEENKKDPVKKQTPPRKFIELENAVLDKFLGGYSMTDTNVLVGFYKDGDYLIGSIFGMGKDYLFPVSGNEFFNYSRNVQILFSSDKAGKVTKAIMTLNGEKKIANAIILDKDSPDSARETPGSYYCSTLGAACFIKKKDKNFILSHRRYEDMNLYCLKKDQFVNSWGFIHFKRDESGKVKGFSLTDELFGWQDLWFVKIPGQKNH